MTDKIFYIYLIDIYVYVRYNGIENIDKRCSIFWGCVKMTRGEIAKDFLKKVVLPVFLAWFLFSMFKNVFTKDGVTDYFNVWLVCGIPFGIWRMRMWLIPHSQSSLQYSIAIWLLNFVIGGLIGGVIIVWRLVVAAWYVILTVFRIVTYNSESNRIAREVVASYPISEEQT